MIVHGSFNVVLLILRRISDNECFIFMPGPTRISFFAMFRQSIFLCLFMVVTDGSCGVSALFFLSIARRTSSSLSPIIGDPPGTVILLRHHQTRFRPAKSCISSLCLSENRNRSFFHTHPSADSRMSGSEQEMVSNNNSSMDTTISPFPRAAVSVAVRCFANGRVHYLLVQRGNEPNKGRWSFPGGKLEWGEPTIIGAKRELQEETQFQGQDNLAWYGGAYTTADSIITAEVVGSTSGSSKETVVTLFHFVIVICFAELTIDTDSNLPVVTATDDAASAKWWPLEQIRLLEETEITQGLLNHVVRAESLYQKGVLSTT